MFDLIKSLDKPEYYRLYLTNGPLALAYLSRQGREHFTLMSCDEGNFPTYAGRVLLKTSDRQELIEKMAGQEASGTWKESKCTSLGSYWMRSRYETDFLQVRSTFDQGK